MYGKKHETKFTVQFSQSDQEHLRVADILNRQGRFGKADYIVSAVMHFINNGNTGAHRPAAVDERHIEAVVDRILRDRAIGAGVMPAAPAGSVSAIRVEEQSQTGTDVVLDEAVEALGGEGLGAIAGALDMFRKKIR